MQILKKTLLSFIFLLMFLGVQSQDIDMNDKALGIYLDAENAFMLEDYSTAFDLYQKVLENDNNFDPAMFQMARIYLFRNQVDEAFKMTKAAYILIRKINGMPFYL